MIKRIALALLMLVSPAFAQVFTTLYLPSAGTGLTLNIAAGQSFCNGFMVSSTATTLSMTASTTNYVYLNTASNCVPAVKLSPFVTADVPIATVTTNGSAITNVISQRTYFNNSSSMIYPSAGIAKSTGSAWSVPTYADFVTYWASGTCNGYLKSDGTCATPATFTFPNPGLVKSTGSAWTAPAYTDITALWTSCSGYLKSDGTCNASAGIPYPSAGIAKSTGSAWGSATYADFVNYWAGGACSGYLNSAGTCSTTPGIPYPSAGLAKSTGSTWTAPSYSDVVALWGTCTTSQFLTAGGNCMTVSPFTYPSAGIVKSTGTAWTSTAYSDVVSLWASGSCTGYLNSNGTCTTNAGIPYPSAGVAVSSGSAWTTPAYTNITSLWASGSCSGFLKSDGSCSTPSGIPYPSAGIAVSTGSAWTTAATYNTITNLWASCTSGVLYYNGTCTTPAGFANPMTSTGDMIYAASAGSPQRLAGAAGWLVWTPSAPSWSPVTATNCTKTGQYCHSIYEPNTSNFGTVFDSDGQYTTAGDLVYYAGSSNGFTRIPIGSTNQVLTVTAGVPTWQTPAAGGSTLTSSSISVIASNRTTTLANTGLSIVMPSTSGSFAIHRINCSAQISEQFSGFPITFSATTSFTATQINVTGMTSLADNGGGNATVVTVNQYFNAPGTTNTFTITPTTNANQIFVVDFAIQVPASTSAPTFNLQMAASASSGYVYMYNLSSCSLMF